jgi:four helix bundle protein
MAEEDNLFRFEHLEVWQRAADLAFVLDFQAETLAQKHLYRFAEQLRSAGMSIPNNIAEGSGSSFTNEFRQFLNFARRSAFECASMLILFERRGLLPAETVRPQVDELNQVSRMITAFSRSLK